jgi:hypothetical protein
MTAIESLTLEVPDPSAADAFYDTFGLGAHVDVRASGAPTTGFRAFTLSVVVSQPSTVDAFIGAALDAGATSLKPAVKGFWGYGGVVRAPDGAIWKVASSSKKDKGLAKDAGVSPDGTGSHRIAPDRPRQRCRTLHRPGRVRVGGRAPRMSAGPRPRARDGARGPKRRRTRNTARGGLIEPGDAGGDRAGGPASRMET